MKTSKEQRAGCRADLAIGKDGYDCAGEWGGCHGRTFYIALIDDLDAAIARAELAEGVLGELEGQVMGLQRYNLPSAVSALEGSSAGEWVRWGHVRSLLPGGDKAILARAKGESE